jgi:hypothetical protein
VSRHGARISSSERGTAAVRSERGTVSTVPQSLHLPLLPAVSSLVRIARPHFGQANLMVMARDPLGLRSAAIRIETLPRPSMETQRQRIKSPVTESSQTAHHQVVTGPARKSE